MDESPYNQLQRTDRERKRSTGENYGMHGDIVIPQREINEAANYANLSKDNTGKSVPRNREDVKQMMLSVPMEENPADDDNESNQFKSQTDNMEATGEAKDSMAAGRISGQYYIVQKQEPNISIDPPPGSPKYVASMMPDIAANLSACNDYEIAVGESTSHDLDELVPATPEFTDDKKDFTSYGSLLDDNHPNSESKDKSDDVGTSQPKGIPGSRSCHPVIHSKENASENIGSKTRRVIFSEDTRTDYTNCDITNGVNIYTKPQTPDNEKKEQFSSHKVPRIKDMNKSVPTNPRHSTWF